MSEWQPMATAPRDRSNILLLLGESIPDTPDVRVASFVSADDAFELGELGPGWMIWHTDGADWYCVREDEPEAWCPLPPRSPSLAGG